MNKASWIIVYSTLTCIGCVEPPSPSSTNSNNSQDMMTPIDMLVDMPADMPVDSDGVDMAADLGRDMPDDTPDQGPMPCDDTIDVTMCASDGLSYTTCEDNVLTIQNCAPWELCTDEIGQGSVPSCEIVPSCLVAPGELGEACEREYLLPGNEPKDGYQYGKEIALSGDGLHMWISAPNDSIPDFSSLKEQVYRFARADTTQPFTFVSVIDSGIAPGEDWGHAISLNEDGSRAVVCGQKFTVNIDSTNVQVGRCVWFEITPDSETRTQLRRNNSRFFGSDVEISPDGNWMIVGARASKEVLIYHSSNLTIPAHTFSLDETLFGITLDVHWEPKESTGGYDIKLVIGAPGSPGRSGGAYWTTMALQSGTSTTPDLMPLTIPPSGVDVKGMGNQVTFNKDGSLIAVSASQTLLTEGVMGSEAGVVMVYDTGPGDGLTNPKVITYPDFTDDVTFEPAFGSALHFDERDWLWIGARNHETIPDGINTPEEKFNGEGRVYVYRRASNVSDWDQISLLDGTFDVSSSTKNFDGYGSALGMFEQDGRVKLVVGGSSSNIYYKLSGQVTLIDVGTPQALDALD